MNFFSRLKDGLTKTRSQIASIVGVRERFDALFYESLEEALIAADIGVDLSLAIIERLKKEIQNRGLTTPSEAYAVLKELLTADLTMDPMQPESATPWVVLVAGVNGVGKTTTIGKIASSFRRQGKKVMLAAADTFRAGAIEQLRVWADRTGCDFVAQHEGADAASVGFDAMEAAVKRGMDVLILDTAGRLHNKINLMNELEKILRVVRRHTPSAPHEILLVIDATTGQNALRQAQVFNEMLGLTGLVITKLDGTAKGGIAFALVRELKVPIKKIGVGEGIDDLQDFNPAEYVEAMFGEMR
ncbi:MAG: signal recognition particle-docking protein FtsY [Chitinispirillaceae bacterium]|nr:signal recognition particle-docking protein FtsY [Chitinispirillaceae bacterium]